MENANGQVPIFPFFVVIPSILHDSFGRKSDYQSKVYGRSKCHGME